MRSPALYDKVDRSTDALEIKQSGLYPFFRASESEQDTEVTLVGGRRVLMLGSNSYMGLTNHPEVKEAAIDAIRKYGTGCAGSRFLNGTLDIHNELEAELAAWVGKPEALLYSTGYQVNQGVIATLAGRHDHIVLDAYDHASIIEGSRLSLAKVTRFPHNDMGRLQTILEEVCDGHGTLVVVDGVFSMEGDIVKLPRLVELCERFGAALMVDDAHSLGVLGTEGSGTASHFGLTDKVDLIMGTFSKSLASVGGFVAADSVTIDYLRHHSRAMIFSASMPPASVASVLAAVRIIRREPERIERLWHNTRLMRDGLQALGYDTGLSETPVIPVHVGSRTDLLMMCRRLEEEGVFVNPVLPPAVPPTDCLLRISLMATHTEAQIAFALDKLDKVGRELGILQAAALA